METTDIKAYSKDLRLKVLDAVDREMPRKQVALIFGVSLPAFGPPRIVWLALSYQLSGTLDHKRYLRLRTGFHKSLVEHTARKVYRGPVAADVRSEVARILRHRLTKSYRGLRCPSTRSWVRSAKPCVQP